LVDKCCKENPAFHFRGHSSFSSLKYVFDVSVNLHTVVNISGSHYITFYTDTVQCQFTGSYFV